MGLAGINLVHGKFGGEHIYICFGITMDIIILLMNFGGVLSFRCIPVLSSSGVRRVAQHSLSQGL